MTELVRGVVLKPPSWVLVTHRMTGPRSPSLALLRGIDTQARHRGSGMGPEPPPLGVHGAATRDQGRGSWRARPGGEKKQRRERLRLLSLQQAGGGLRRQVGRVRTGGSLGGDGGSWAAFMASRRRDGNRGHALLGLASPLTRTLEMPTGAGEEEPGVLLRLSLTPTIPRGPRDGGWGMEGQGKAKQGDRGPRIQSSLSAPFLEGRAGAGQQQRSPLWIPQPPGLPSCLGLQGPLKTGSVWAFTPSSARQQWGRFRGQSPGP